LSAELVELRDATTEIAAEAAALVMRGYRRPGEIHKKGRIDLVTDFDLRSEALIVERLSRLCPTDAIVAEETRRTAAVGRVWYVDPIDGTTNFAHGHPFFCVSIGCYEDARPLVGVIHAPALGVVWTCAAGNGALRNGERCQVSHTASLGDALLATGFPYDRASSVDNNYTEFMALKRIVRGVRRCGSSALDLAFVADGS
jgi:myo-inositol-1(or 4)-monophosphatase